jgi:hypothetical protein
MKPPGSTMAISNVKRIEIEIEDESKDRKIKILTLD